MLVSFGSRSFASASRTPVSQLGRMAQRGVLNNSKSYQELHEDGVSTGEVLPLFHSVSHTDMMPRPGQAVPATSRPCSI